jgi:protein TonB
MLEPARKCAFRTICPPAPEFEARSCFGRDDTIRLPCCIVSHYAHQQLSSHAMIHASATLIRGSAFGVSALMHVALAAVVGGHGAAAVANRSATDRVEVSVEIEPSEAPAPALESASASRSDGHRTHRHAYPVPKTHDERPHDPALVHVPLASHVTESAPLVSPVLQAPPAEPVRFVLPREGAPRTVARSVTLGGSSGLGSSVSEATLPANAVSVPARLLASATLSYPPEARRAEVEADIPVEIVLDTAGRVLDARALKQSGYGLGEAAVHAIYAYKFSPAFKDGRPVRVRMRWTVQFRLR